MPYTGHMFDETYSEGFLARYGKLPSGQVDLGRLLNHRSVREFSDHPIDESVMEALVAAAQSAATSSNLQLWSVVSVQDPARREEIARLSSNQDQVRNANWFLAFVADHDRILKAAESAGESGDSLEYTEFWMMACIDVALAAERMVCAAESLGIGTCYIGALRNFPDEVSRLLKLPEKCLGLFGLCLGWPAENCKAEIKPRLAQESVWFREEYGQPDLAEYESRMSTFYEQQGMNPSVTWSMRSGRRISGELNGREVWREVLDRKNIGTK